MIKDKRIGVISLGCDKNRVDTEKMLYILSKNHTLTPDIENAQIIIVNTCAFIESARKEGIEEILSACEYKQNGVAEKIIITGCLPQKHGKELLDGILEIDGILGVSDYDRINEVIERIYNGERVNEVGLPKGECGKRRVLTTDGYAYLKVADGCSNHCTYCTIPSIRGKFRSVLEEDLIEEAKSLGEVNELILVAQDLTRYGEDLTPKSSLVNLIRKLSVLDNVKGIRLLYCYPEGITDELIREMRENAKIIRYIDMPLQHASDRVLKLMNRRGSFNEYISLIEKLKREVSGIAIRSTFITGFPTETEEDHNILLDFIKQAKLSNVGFFKYSKEAGTPASRLKEQVKANVKEKRLRSLYREQKKIVKEENLKLKGKVFKVVAEGFDENELVYFGRAYFNAPDIDGKVYFFSAEEVEYGKFYDVKILKASTYDLYGERL